MKKEIFISIIFSLIFLVICLVAIYKIKGIIQNYEDQRNYELTKNINFNLPNLIESGGIDIHSQNHLQVWLDNKFVGTSPLKLTSITPGYHSILVKSENYRDYFVEVQVEKGKFTIVNPILFSDDPKKLIDTKTILTANEFIQLGDYIITKSSNLASSQDTANYELLSLKKESVFDNLISLDSNDSKLTLFQTIANIEFDNDTKFVCLYEVRKQEFLDKCNFKFYSTSGPIDLGKYIDDIAQVEILTDSLILRSNNYVYNFNLDTKTIQLVHKLNNEEFFLGKVSDFLAFENSANEVDLYESSATEKKILTISNVTRNSFVWNDLLVTPLDNSTKFTNSKSEIFYLSGKYRQSLNPEYLENDDDDFFTNLYFKNGEFGQVAKSNIKNIARVQLSDNFLLVDNFQAKSDSYIYFSDKFDNVFILKYQEGYKVLFIIQGKVFLESEFEGKSKLTEVLYLK